MAKYMIHAVPKRLWYVEKYLKPSMIKQGIREEDITLYVDANKEGNLRACMTAFGLVDDDDKGTWHLQDDVAICNEFRILTETLDAGIVCGFSTEMYDGPGNIGSVNLQKMWFSFPCIRIPNQYALECSKWVPEYVIGNPVYRDYWKNGANDDWSFRAYLSAKHKNEIVLNVAPNLVDHVEYLIGGTSSGKERDSICRAQYWEDEDVIERLKRALAKEENLL